MDGTGLQKKLLKKDRKKDLIQKNIDSIVEKTEAYFKSKPTLSKSVPEIKVVVYNRVAYPILYEVSRFFYLGGDNIYFVMKSKCVVRKTPSGSRYYEVIASEEDIEIGKSPIVPQGCPKDRSKIYPADIEKLQVKV